MTIIATLEAVSTQSVQFHGQPIITAMVSGAAYVAMKQVVENIGMDWAAQFVKLRSQKDKFNCCDIAMVAADGKIRNLLCIPLRKLNGWLFSINPAKVRADIQDKLIAYQEECFTALYDYWTKGEAKRESKQRKSTAAQLIPLRQTAERLIATGLGKIYPDIWKFVHQHFEIEHINQLQPSQISEAVTYLDALEGEFLGKQQTVAGHRYHFPVETADPHNRTFANDWISAQVILDERNRAPELELLDELKKDGFDVQGAAIRIHAMYDIAKQFIHMQSELSGMRKYLSAMNDIVKNQTVERGMNVCFTGQSKGHAVGGYAKRCLPR